MTIRSRERLRDVLMWLLALVYLTAGILHLALPEPFLGVTPHWVPFPRQVVQFTGLCEIAGAIALPTRLRWLAGLMFALYAICVYPANIQHAINSLSPGGQGPGWGYHGPRLLFQPVFVWWALFAGRVIDWPLRRLH